MYIHKNERLIILSILNKCLFFNGSAKLTIEAQKRTAY